MKKTKNTKDQLEKEHDKSIQALLQGNFYEFVRDILVPSRVILATFLVFMVFLVTDQALFWIFETIIHPIKTKIPFVGWLLDGLNVFSTICIVIYFVISGIASLRTQWQISKKIEQRAGLE